MRTWDAINEVIKSVSYPGLTIGLYMAGGDNAYLQVVDLCAVNNDTGAPCISKGRKMLLSRHMVDGEIVQTAWLAIQLYLEHEAREKFTYRGQRVFDPHYDILAMAKFRSGLYTQGATPIVERGYGVIPAHTCWRRTDGELPIRTPCAACLGLKDET